MCTEVSLRSDFKKQNSDNDRITGHESLGQSAIQQKRKQLSQLWENRNGLCPV